MELRGSGECQSGREGYDGIQFRSDLRRKMDGTLDRAMGVGLGVGLLVRNGMRLAVRAAVAASLGAGAERIAHDPADGAGAAAALRTAAKTIVDLSRRARQIAHRGGHRGPYVTVGQDIAGADDHEELAIR